MAQRPDNSPKKSKKKKLSKKKKKTSYLPSESEIINFAITAQGLVGKEAIARHFKLKGTQRAGLKRLLQKMREDGLLAPLVDAKHKRAPANIKAPKSKLPPTTVLRVVGLDGDGEIVLEPTRWDESDQGPRPTILLQETGKKGKLRSDNQPPGEGDLILARITPVKNSDNTYNARVLKRLEGNRESLLGVVRQAGKFLRIVPTDKKSRYEFEISGRDTKGAKAGDLVKFEIKPGQTRSIRKVNVLERMGNIDDHQNISIIALTEQGIPVELPPSVEAETAAFKDFDISKALKRGNHTDMRDTALITIDPPDAKDHDDAIWAEADGDLKNHGGYKIIVAIADVAFYVRSHSDLDREAQKRGNSTYLPNQVVPMLPERLSNDLCSLKENIDRPALACFMIFDKDGKKLKHHFDRIVMKSAAKLSYRQAQDAIDGKPCDVARPLLDPVLKPLWAAYAVLQKGRNKRQPLNLELPERKLIFDTNGLVKDVVVTERFDAHKLVEEFMIQANVAAAESLELKRVPVIYRVHDAPSSEKLIVLADFLKSLNLSAPKGQVMKPANFNSILGKVSGSEHEHVVNQVILRSQAQAVYSTENLGHFGLNLRRYAHFTSPIRRYADLTVHRALIKAFGLGDDGQSSLEAGQLEAIAEEISNTERRSMMAERDTKDRMISNFLSEKIDSIFSGRIGGMAGAGLFVTLDGSGADGFIPVSTLEGDYFLHDEKTMAMVGERTGETFQIGDKVQVKLIRSTPVSGGLQLEMVSQGKPGKPAGRKRRSFSRGKVRGGNRGRGRR